jgi:membrane fusion protein (multidrug efflux system)
MSRHPIRGACLSGLLWLVACGGGDAGTQALRLPPVTVEPVRVQTLEDRIEATGELLAPERAEIAAEVPGRVTEILVAEGSRVEAGTVVLEIDPERRELEVASVGAQLAEAKAALAEMQRDAERIRTLHGRNVASDSRLDQAETQLALARSRQEAAEAALGVAQRALRDASVTAPFAGFVAQRRVSRGEFVNAGQPLFELVALDPIEVELHLPEVDAGRVRLDQPLALTVAPWPGEVFHATLTYVSPTIDPRSRTLRVKAQLANPDGRLRPGLFARADLGVAQRPGVAMIPEESILQRADGAVAFRLLGDRVERVHIETGVHRDGWVEVVKGLGPPDRVVVRGHADLSDGMAVAVQDPAPHSAVTAVSEESARSPLP